MLLLLGQNSAQIKNAILLLQRSFSISFILFQRKNMNPILSHHYPSCCASVSRFPYVGRIAVDKEDVKFVCQFVKKNVTKYKYEKNSESENHYITGTPIKFPNYENFSRAFSMVYFCIFSDIIYYSPIKNNLILCYKILYYLTFFTLI